MARIEGLNFIDAKQISVSLKDQDGRIEFRYAKRMNIILWDENGRVNR